MTTNASENPGVDKGLQPPVLDSPINPGSARVAVIGASGIGKHHVNWWTLEGADVCAFAGTSPESVARAAKGLEELCGFSGRGYTDVQTLLEQERPEIVDVCSPARCHADHVRAALDAGCHVLCEKPFVYQAGAPRDELMAQAHALVDLAANRGLRLSVCTQYSWAARAFARIWAEHRPGEVVTHYHGHLESPAKNRPPDPERIWADLSPHLISVLLALEPDAHVDWESLVPRFQGYEACADFQVKRESGPAITVALVTRNALGPPLNVRHFKYNGYPFVVEGQRDEAGVYCARIETPDGAWVEQDMMRGLIGDFLRGTPTVNSETCLANLDLMLRLLEAARSA